MAEPEDKPYPGIKPPVVLPSWKTCDHLWAYKEYKEIRYGTGPTYHCEYYYCQKCLGQIRVGGPPDAAQG